MSTIEKIRELLDSASSMQDGHQAFSIVQEAVRLADSVNDVFWGLAARSWTMRLSRSLLLTKELAAAFTWTLAKYAEDPERYAEFNPIWEFRWVTSLLSNFPSITIEKRDELLTQMSQHYQQAGWSEQAVHEVRLAIAEDYADHQMATDARQALRANPERDSEMEYTLEQREVGYWVFMQDDEKAVESGATFLRAPDHEAHLNPQMCALLLLPLLRLGRLDIANSVEPRVRRPALQRADKVYHWPNGNLLVFWALTSTDHPDRLLQALSLYERYQQVISRFSDPLTQAHFYMDSLPLLNRLAKSGNALPISLPSQIEADVRRKEQGYDPVGLREWMLNQAAELTCQFDARNGNDYFTRQLAARRDL